MKYLKAATQEVILCRKWTYAHL